MMEIAGERQCRVKSSQSSLSFVTKMLFHIKVKF